MCAPPRPKVTQAKHNYVIPTCLLLDVCWLTYVCPSAGSGHGIKTGSPQTCAFIPEPEQSIDVVGIDRPTTALGYQVDRVLAKRPFFCRMAIKKTVFYPHGLCGGLEKMTTCRLGLCLFLCVPVCGQSLSSDGLEQAPAHHSQFEERDPKRDEPLCASQKADT